MDSHTSIILNTKRSEGGCTSVERHRQERRASFREIFGELGELVTLTLTEEEREDYAHKHRNKLTGFGESETCFLGETAEGALAVFAVKAVGAELEWSEYPFDDRLHPGLETNFVRLIVVRQSREAFMKYFFKRYDP